MSLQERIAELEGQLETCNETISVQEKHLRCYADIVAVSEDIRACYKREIEDLKQEVKDYQAIVKVVEDKYWKLLKKYLKKGETL